MTGYFSVTLYLNDFSIGNVYIADFYNHRIRKVTASTGIITTVAGTGIQTYSGDNGQATSAGLNLPSGVGLDSSGNVYIVDTYNNRIRKVTVSIGIITPTQARGQLAIVVITEQLLPRR